MSLNQTVSHIVEMAQSRGHRSLYLCHPYRGDVEANVARVKTIAKKLMAEAAGKNFAVELVAPQLWLDQMLPPATGEGANCFVSNASRERFAMRVCLQCVKSSDALVVCFRQITDGMAEEIEYASILGKRIFWLDAD